MMKANTREEEVITYLLRNTYFIKVSLPQFLPKTSQRCPQNQISKKASKSRVRKIAHASYFSNVNT